jgi:PKHD-type hydroxylase
MENLMLPEIDLSQPPELNMAKAGWWSLKNDSLEEYRFIEGVFTPQECNEIIKLGKSFSIDQSKTGDGRGFSDIRKSRNSWLPPSEITNWVYERIQQAVMEANKHFEFDLHSIENLQFTEYDGDYKGNYGKHIDKFGGASSPNTHRKLSFSIQLSCPSKYEGGELAIFNQKDPMVANKSQGCINFFPSYVLHEVKPVTKGRRYCLVSWCSGPKFK